MQIGFIARAHHPLSEADVRFAAEHGMPHLELVWDDFTEEHFARRQAEKQLLREHGVRLGAAGFWRRNPIHPDPEQRRRVHEELKRYLDYCGELECPVLITGGGTLLGPGVEECAAEFARAFPPILEHAEKRGVKIALYGLHGADLSHERANWLLNLPAYERVWRDFPKLGLKYDAANWLGQRLDPIEPLRRHGAKIFHVHIKDHLYHGGELVSQPPAGMGDVPFPKLLALLYEHGYDGMLSIEPHGPWQKRPELREKMLRLSKNYLTPMIL